MNDNSTDVYALINRAKAGDSRAREMVIENNMGLVGSIVKKYLSRGQEYEDLFQIGSIGLIKAVDRFDTDYGVMFSTYAVPMIIGEIKRYMRDDGILKVSRSIKELSYKIKQIKEELLRESGNEPTVKEVAERLGIDVEEAVIAIESSYMPESLQEPVSDEDSSLSLMDRINQETVPYEETIIDKLDLKLALQDLDPYDKQIMILRYYKNYTQSQVAKILNISQVQVSRLEKKIIGIIKKKISILT